MENNIDLTQKTKVRVRKSYVGKKFNNLTIIKEIGNGRVIAKCDCGNVIEAKKYNIILGQKNIVEIKNVHINRLNKNLLIILMI